MEFGRMHLSELDQIDYSLKDDPPETVEFLNGLQPTETKIYAGCAKWGMKEWVGKVYPPDSKEDEFLELYTRYFNSLELNSTFYNIQRKNIENWASRVAGADIKLCPKFNRKISHAKNFEEEKARIMYFAEAMQLFGNNLGVCFLQFPDYFARKRLGDLENLLKIIPSDLPVNVELRNKGWFSENGEDGEDVFSLLQSLNKGTVITDTAGRRDCLHMRITSPHVIIRFAGNNMHPTDFTRIDHWAEKIKKWYGYGKLSSIYFFVHHDDEAFSPYTAKYAIDRINTECGLRLKSPPASV